MLWRRGKLLAPAGNRTPAVQPVARLSASSRAKPVMIHDPCSHNVVHTVCVTFQPVMLGVTEMEPEVGGGGDRKWGVNACNSSHLAAIGRSRGLFLAAFVVCVMRRGLSVYVRVSDGD
jgi:hypothetical protein